MYSVYSKSKKTAHLFNINFINFLLKVNSLNNITVKMHGPAVFIDLTLEDQVGYLYKNRVYVSVGSETQSQHISNLNFVIHL